VIVQQTATGTTYWRDMNAGTGTAWGAVTGAMGTDWLVV
jgi:hypothetical protein